MKKFHYIYSHQRKEFYTGVKNYEWTSEVLRAMAWEVKPSLGYLNKFKGEFIEIKTLYV